MSPTRAPGRWAWLLTLPLFVLGGWAIGHFSGSGELPPPADTVTVVRTAGDGRVKEARARAAAHRARMSSSPTVPGAAAAGSEPTAEPSDWTTLDDALARSRMNGKPVLLDFSAEWCGPCQMLKRQVFDDGTRGNAVRRAVIPVAVVDRVREDGRNTPEVEGLQRRYGVQAFPTLVVFHPETGRMESARGFGGADATLRWIENAARSVR